MTEIREVPNFGESNWDRGYCSAINLCFLIFSCLIL